ncbi:MAG: helix-turn-helix domain-containing protein [Alphaproteobacteria bacterium]|nr:helix-turn-helix domain-containing protein [Alphaproteobacteria bacterium]
MEREGSKLSENILACLKQSGLNQKSAAVKAGLSETAIRDILVGRSKNPRADTIRKIADLFGCTPAELLGNDQDAGDIHISPITRARENKGLSVTELSKILNVNPGRISEIEKGHFLPSLDWLERLAGVLGVSPVDLMPNNKMLTEEHLSVLTRSVPLISFADAYTWQNLFDNDPDDWVPTTAQVGLNSYALRVNRDSMEPKFPMGCIIIVDPEADIKSGNFVIAKINKENPPVFRQYIEEGGQKFLRALNSSFPMLDISKNLDLTFFGRVMQSMMDFNNSL